MVLRPHVRAAHHLARWLMRTAEDAEDALQEAILRAFRSFGRQRPTSPRAWLLRIVRNCCYDLRERNGREPPAARETNPGEEREADVVGLLPETAETRLGRISDWRALEAALADLAPEFREAFLLREIEELSYKEIADITAVPVGTVMSRLYRARAQLRARLSGWRKETA